MAARRAQPAKSTIAPIEEGKLRDALAREKASEKQMGEEAQPKVQQRAKDAEPLVPGGSAAAARAAGPGDFIKAKIPDKIGSVTVFGRGGKESVHAGGETVEMTRAQAERIGAVEAKRKPEPASGTGEEE